MNKENNINETEGGMDTRRQALGIEITRDGRAVNEKNWVVKKDGSIIDRFWSLTKAADYIRDNYGFEIECSLGSFA